MQGGSALQKGIVQNRKRLTLILCSILAIIMFTACGDAATEAPKGSQDTKSVTTGSFTDNKNGTVSFSYNNTNKERCKVVTRLEGGKMYQYDVPQGECEMVFPLSQGNGTYVVYLCINTTGNRYSVLESVNITLDLEDDLKTFLCSNRIIDWDKENEAIKKAYALTKNSETDEDKIGIIYDYMVENFSYDYDKMENIDKLASESAYVPDIDETYAAKMGICYDISALTAAMLRSISIPAKVVTGYSSNTISYHAWNRIYFMKRKDWRTVDITYDIEMYKDGKRYSMIKNDDYYQNIMYEY